MASRTSNATACTSLERATDGSRSVSSVRTPSAARRSPVTTRASRSSARSSTAPRSCRSRSSTPIYITKLLVRDHVVFGAYGFDLEDGTRYVIHADAVILAAGGHTRIWRHTSSRRDENTGDAFRLAVEAGGRIRDPELVQFHPSGLIEPENAAGTLVSEAARGEGGILRNGLGERFMSRYDPERMELSTRDRVALACYTEIKEGRGTANGGVWLDVSHLPRETIMRASPARLPDAPGAADARHHDDADRDRTDRALLDGRRLGAPGGPRHGRGGTLRDRRGVERPARRESPRRELPHRAARVRTNRRRSGRRVLGATRRPSSAPRPRWQRHAARSTRSSPPTVRRTFGHSSARSGTS